MGFIIADSKSKDITLRLIHDEDGTVTLTGTEGDGTEWHLLLFKNGRFERIESVSDDSGIDVDERGRIEERKDDN